MGQVPAHPSARTQGDDVVESTKSRAGDDGKGNRDQARRLAQRIGGRRRYRLVARGAGAGFYLRRSVDGAIGLGVQGSLGRQFSSVVEQRFCKPSVVGSNPTTG